MPHQATLKYNEPILRQAVFVFWRRTVGVGIPVTLVVGLCCLAVLLLQDGASWIVGALATFFSMIVAFIVAVYVAHLRMAMRKLHDMEASQLVFIAGESSFTIISTIASSALAWSVVREVWRFPTYWVLLFSKAHFFTFPLAGVSQEMQTFVIERIQGAGGKVDG
jgi:hypothetical protein